MNVTGNKHIDNAIDEIDAAMFSGDTFINPEAAQNFKGMLERWGRQIESNLMPDEEPVNTSKDEPSPE
jgi:hypothetical protein